MRRRRLAGGIVIAVFVNLLAIAACVLSAGGQTTIVEIEIVEDTYLIRIDGKQVIPPPRLGGPERAVLETPERGSIWLTLLHPVPSLPDSQGIDSVVVTDFAGRELFRDDFESLNDGRWRITNGSFRIENGVLVAASQPGHNTVELDGPGWGDHILRVTYRNTMGIEIGARSADRGGIKFGADLVRDFPIFLEGYAPDGTWSGTEFGERIQTSKSQVIKSIAAMGLKSYPFILIGAFAGIAVSAVMALAEGRLGETVSGTWRRFGPAVAVAHTRVINPSVIAILGAAAFAFAVTLYIIREVYRGPQLPDESSYLFQAKLFAAGRITGTIPPVKEAFYSWEPNFLYEHGESWSTLYPFGQPLILTPGALIDAMWLIPPLVGAGCVVLMFLVGRQLYDARTGVISAILLAASPFFLMQASTYMSHNTWALYMLLSLLFLVKRDRMLYGLLSGLFFGLALNTRTAESLTLVLPFGGVLVGYVIFAGSQARLRNLKYLAAFTAGGGLTLLAMLSFNAATTGELLLPSYTAWSRETEGAEVIGFVDGHTLGIGLRSLQTQLMAFILVFNAWPVWIGLAFVLLPFLLGTRNGWDYFLVVCALLVAGIYILYSSSMLYQGPRYWYQTVPFLMLLLARGLVLAGHHLGDAAALLRQRLIGDARPARWAGGLVIYMFLSLLLLRGTGGWLFAWNQDWTERDVPQVQNNLEELPSIYGFDDRLLELASDLNLQNALILVMPCGEHNPFACYNTVFHDNSVAFDGNLVWARYIPEYNEALLAAFPDRDIYIADYAESSIIPYDPDEQMPSGS